MTDHAPEPTSPTGRVDSPVTCSVCGESLVLSQRERADGTLEWDHLSSPPADDVREALKAAIKKGRLNRIAAGIAWAGAGEDDPYPTGGDDDYSADAILAAFEVRLRGTVTDTEKPGPVVMHVASGTGTACGLSRDRVSHITDGVRYADCVPCLRMVAQT